MSQLLCCVDQVGVYEEPSLDDFKWATSVFWSRGLGVPVPVMQQQQGREPGSSSSSSVRIETLEGLVPGLDFANHSQQVSKAPYANIDIIRT
jgi:hypothetical protein